MCYLDIYARTYIQKKRRTAPLAKSVEENLAGHHRENGMMPGEVLHDKVLNSTYVRS